MATLAGAFRAALALTADLVSCSVRVVLFDRNFVDAGVGSAPGWSGVSTICASSGIGGRGGATGSRIRTLMGVSLPRHARR